MSTLAGKYIGPTVWQSVYGGVGYAKKVLGYDPIAYWPLWELSGDTAECLVNSPAQDGTYTGVTLGQPGIGDGNTAPYFDGANDYVNVFSAALATAFGYDEGTFAIWWRVVNAGIWTDNTWHFVARFMRQTNPDQTSILKNNDNNWRWIYTSNNVDKAINLATTPITWQHTAMTWSLANGEVIAYHNGVQSGAPQANIDAWGDKTLDNTRAVIGAAITTPTLVWHGWLAHGALWDTPLAAPRIANLATV